LSLRYKVIVNLGIIAHNLEDDNPVNFKILTVGKGGVPKLILYDDQKVEDVLSRIVKKYLETHSEWPEKHFCSVVNSKGSVYLNYITIIPDNIKNKSGSWITMFNVLSKEEQIDPNYSKIIKHINLALTGR
jgi:hypothetical protein